jgi:cytoskeletal protein RodZ
MLEPMDEGERRWQQATRKRRWLLSFASIAVCVLVGALGFWLAYGRSPTIQTIAEPLTNPLGLPSGQAAPRVPPPVATDGGSPSASASASGSPTPSASVTPGLRDGSLEFNVRATLCGQDTVGNGTFYRSAVGDYCIVTVTVRNVSDQPVTLGAIAQQATTTDGQQSAVDWTASVAATSGSPAVNQPIPPQGQLETIMAFDVPEDGILKSLTLHGAADSPGVTVTLR